MAGEKLGLIWFASARGALGTVIEGFARGLTYERESNIFSFVAKE
jgi:hypothetical protein